MIRLLAAFLALATFALVDIAVAQSPPWTEHYLVWLPHRSDPHPWRTDPHLASRFTEPGYPDDVQVLFANPDSQTGAKHEVMWVTVIAASPATDQYLGILINPPDQLHNVQHGDNVVFAWSTKDQWPKAVPLPDGSYAAGWPVITQRSRRDSVLRAGVRAYRAGANGHNMPGIEECIRLLKTLTPSELSSASPDFQYVAYFTIGRCSAEKYATMDAVTAFTKAVELAPDSLDSQMGLLAEYSVLASTPAAKLAVGSEGEWEGTFLAHLASVRQRFASDTETMRLLDWILAPHSAQDSASLSPQDLAKRHRIGFAVLRWKQR